MQLKNTEKLENSYVSLTIEVEPAELEKAKDKAFKKEGRKIQVPGFRKGKAPRMLIERMYGDIFFEDALNLIFPDLMDQAVEQAGVKPVGRPEVDFGEDAPKGGAVLIVKVAVEPEVTLGEYKGLTAEKAEVKVLKKEIKEEIERLAKRMARVETVERAAKKGDIVTIDFEGSIDGVPFSGGAAQNHNLELGSGSFIPGFEDQLIGCAAGDEKDVVVTFPEDYNAEELKGKEAVFKCMVHAVKQTVLPEMDDEFAKDVSETADTMEDLEKEISERLNQTRSDAAERELEEKLLDQVIESMQAEIPEVMYETEASNQMNDFAYRIQMQGVSIEQYVQMNGMDMRSFRDAFRPQAERQVKVRLALNKIAELENIEITKEDIEAEYSRLCDNYGMEDEQLRSMLSESVITSDLKITRALTILKDNAKIKKISRRKKAEAEAAETETGTETESENEE